jgi:hypothetical protein
MQQQKRLRFYLALKTSRTNWRSCRALGASLGLSGPRPRRCSEPPTRQSGSPKTPADRNATKSVTTVEPETLNSNLDYLTVQKLCISGLQLRELPNSIKASQLRELRYPLLEPFPYQQIPKQTGLEALLQWYTRTLLQKASPPESSTFLQLLPKHLR